jgi:hypothetical protein
MGRLTFYVDALAQDFINWFSYHIRGGEPVEEFYDVLLLESKWTWDEIDILHDDKNWWRVGVDLVDLFGKQQLRFAGALACCLTQTRSNPKNPRLKVEVTWDVILAASAWVFLKSTADAYPEGASDIATWQASKEGQAAHLALLTCKYYKESMLPDVLELRKYIVGKFVNRSFTESSLTWEYICENVYEANEERGIELLEKVQQQINHLPGGCYLWMRQMLERARLARAAQRYGRAVFDHEKKEKFEAELDFWVHHSRVEAWADWRASLPNDLGHQHSKYQDLLRRNEYYPTDSALVSESSKPVDPKGITAISSRDRTSPDHSEKIVVGHYGTCRDLSYEDVKQIVKRCRDYQERGGTVPSFYEMQNISPGEPGSYELETLRSWLYDPKFR